jgi:2'-5' RNA ligase
MSEPETSPLILTLKLDPKTFAYFDRLRQQHFPAARNFLPAHITLFHTLPGEEISQIQEALQDRCSQTSILPIVFQKPRFLGKGVAIEVDCPQLVQLHRELAQIWHNWLTRQDQQGYRPHITIQNKTSPDIARQLYEQLKQEWQLQEGQGEGLLLWSYLGGPWKLITEFTFTQN